MNKIKFHTGSNSPFFNALNKEVQHLINSKNILSVSRRLLWLKMVFYFSLHGSSYLLLFLAPHNNLLSLVANYVFTGLSGMLLAFNVSHDACHETFSKNKWVNHWLYHISFNMQGTNAYLWKVRHTSSHHLFPNVDDCDVDIDNNRLLRLSPQHPLRKYQRFQHLYSLLLYISYTLYWIFWKDFIYLTKKKLANLTNMRHPVREWILFFAWKFVYLFILVVLPVISGYSFKNIGISFLIMNCMNSLFFIHSLIVTHLCMETQFPKADAKGYLPGDYYIHQVTTSLDYSPTSKFHNWFFGGFNSHAAHHLYPKLPHTIYPYISPIIEQKAKEFNVSYNKLPLLKAIKSHYRYLKIMGRQKFTSLHAINAGENKVKSSSLLSA